MRKVEIQIGGGWYESDHTIESAGAVGLAARYVGGVLECRNIRTGEWQRIPDQSMTIDERRAHVGVNVEYRLRPYDDAPAAPLTAKWQGRCIQCGSPFSLTIPTGRDAHYACPCGWTTLRDGDRIDRRPSTDQRRSALSHDPQGRGVIVDLDAVAEGIQRARDEKQAMLDRLAEQYEQSVRQRDQLAKQLAHVADELQPMKDRVRELEAECFRWRRRAEDAERKAKVRR